MPEPLCDADAVLAYIREEAQAGAEQAKALRALSLSQMVSAETVTNALLEQFACAVHVHTMYLGVLRSTVDMSHPLDCEEDD